jgi:hypothetical protein
VLVLDKSASMEKIKLFSNKWIDLVFETMAQIAFVLDDDQHIPIYIAQDDQIQAQKKLLNPKNLKDYVIKHVKHDTYNEIYYGKTVAAVAKEYKNITKKHDPVLVIILTDGYGQDNDQLKKELAKITNLPIYIHFLILYGKTIPKSFSQLKKIGKQSNNMSVSVVPSFSFTNRVEIQDKILKNYSKYLKRIK